MGIYTLMMAVFIPLLINIIIYIRIFIHIRSSIRRVQPQTTNSLTNANNIQQVKITRREISLVKQVIFMFTMFLCGWSPIYSLVVLDDIIYLNRLTIPISVLFGEVCLLSIIIHLFIYNCKLRKFLLNKILSCLE